MRPYKFLIFTGICSILLAGCGSRRQESSESPYDTSSAKETESATDPGTENSASDGGKTDISALEGVIEEQTFDVTLDGWGEVRFASFLPEEKQAGEPLGDVRFKLLKDGETLYSLPGWNAENTLSDRQFKQIAAIAFRDFDEDGRTDIMILCEYTPLFGTEIENSDREVRVYTQNGENKDFVIDRLLSEYLTKQRLTESIADIMSAREAYRDYLASMDGSHGIAAQLGIIVDHMDMWFAKPDYANDLYCYAVTDLNFDGRLELIVANCGGTGYYTYSRFYEVNERFDGLSECETGYREGDSQPDIIEDYLSVFCNGDGVFHYIVNDYLKVSMAETYLITSAMTLQNGKITNQPLRRLETSFSDGTENIAYTDGMGNKISETEYLNAIENAFEGLTPDTISFGWQDAAELEGLSHEELIKKLEESYDKYMK